jgi:hypothetical protein
MVGGETMDNYWDFLAYHARQEDMRVERFIPGRNGQITLRYDPAGLPGNGVVWTGGALQMMVHGTGAVMGPPIDGPRGLQKVVSTA